MKRLILLIFIVIFTGCPSDICYIQPANIYTTCGALYFTFTDQYNNNLMNNKVINADSILILDPDEDTIRFTQDTIQGETCIKLIMEKETPFCTKIYNRYMAGERTFQYAFYVVYRGTTFSTDTMQIIIYPEEHKKCKIITRWNYFLYLIRNKQPVILGRDPEVFSEVIKIQKQ